MKKCSRCKTEKPLSAFNPMKMGGQVRLKKDGSLRYNSVCKPCSTRYTYSRGKQQEVYYDKHGWPTGEKECTCCLQVKNFDDFFKAGNGKQGRQAHCKDCVSAQKLVRRTYIRDNISTEYIAAATEMRGRAVKRAKKSGLECTITPEDLLPLPTHCPVFGIKLVYMAVGRMKDDSASLDRFDSRKGYIPGNVEIICLRANNLKKDANTHEMNAIANWMSNRSPRSLLKGGSNHPLSKGVGDG